MHAVRFHGILGPAYPPGQYISPDSTPISSPSERFTLYAGQSVNVGFARVYVVFVRAFVRKAAFR